jgi:hypothetical protein
LSFSTELVAASPGAVAADTVAVVAVAAEENSRSNAVLMANTILDLRIPIIPLRISFPVFSLVLANGCSVSGAEL